MSICVHLWFHLFRSFTAVAVEFLVDPPGRWNDGLLDGLVELEAVSRCVVKTQILLPAKRPIIGKAGVAGHLQAQLHELLPEVVDRPQLVKANALFQVSTLAGEGLGIVVLSPLVIKLAGAPAMGLVGAALYLIALPLVASLPRSPADAGPGSPGRSDPGFRERRPAYR